jgi:two-component system, NtrC family, sensor kinase
MPLLKTIANILVVDIDRPGLGRQLASYGYHPIIVPSISSIADVEDPYALTLIHERLLLENWEGGSDRLHFLNDSAPLVVLVDDPMKSDRRLLQLFSEGTLEWVCASEIDAGLLGCRIDRLYIASTLNKSLQSQQQDQQEKERLKKEITLRDSVLDHERELNANITASITSGLVVIDLRGVVIMLNENARTLLKLSNTDYLGTPYTKVLRGKIRLTVDDFMKRANQESPHHEIKKISSDASVSEIYIYKMRDSRRVISGVLMLINDITEQENTTQQLYRAEKLATMGTMLSGIAHELRNPLSIISARAQMARTKKNIDNEWLFKNYESIEAQAFRCATIINNLLDFTRYRATQLGLQKVESLLDETLTYVEYQKSFDGITIRKNYTPGLAVYGDRSRFVQAFLNIIINASDAMNGAGTLTLTSRQEERGWVIIEIIDTGDGIDSKVKNRIFDPFFTTKEPGKGTGLGLAVVHKIIHESGGDVWFASEPGSTTFFVKLPTGKKRHE